MPFCKNCGNETEPGAEYCRKCGQRVGEGSVGDEIGREIGDSIRKSIIVESIPEVQLIDAIFGGLVVVLIGGVLYLAASGAVSWVGWSNFWAYFLLGLGVLLLIKGIAMFLIRPARNKAYRRHPGRPHPRADRRDVRHAALRGRLGDQLADLPGHRRRRHRVRRHRHLPGPNNNQVSIERPGRYQTFRLTVFLMFFTFMATSLPRMLQPKSSFSVGWYLTLMTGSSDREADLRAAFPR